MKETSKAKQFLTGLRAIRNDIVETIRETVAKNDHILGTFYMNKGITFVDGDFREYETSPVVVLHNTLNRSYGGFEGATLYELFTSESGKLICVLNGEGGEFFNEPIENIQIESLIGILEWIEDYDL